MFKSLVVLFSVLGAAPAAFAQSGPPPMPPEARGFEQGNDFRGPDPRSDFRGDERNFRGPDEGRPGFRGDERDFRGPGFQGPEARPEFRGDERDFRGPAERPDFRGDERAFRGGPTEGPRGDFHRGFAPERGCAYGEGRYGRFGHGRWFEHGRYDWGRHEGHGRFLPRPQPGRGFRYY